MPAIRRAVHLYIPPRFLIRLDSRRSQPAYSGTIPSGDRGRPSSPRFLAWRTDRRTP
jgi:hypothetical protein